MKRGKGAGGRKKKTKRVRNSTKFNYIFKLDSLKAGISNKKTFLYTFPRDKRG